MNKKGENKIVRCDETKIVFLCESKKYGNKEVTVDVEDWINIKGYHWGMWLTSYGCFHATTNIAHSGKRMQFSLHRFILSNPENKDVDHKNHDTLDNRKENLRECSRSENNANSRLRTGSKSGFKGVSWDADRGKWRACISIKHKYKQIGRFENIITAARAYNAAAVKYFGEFAFINEGI